MKFAFGLAVLVAALAFVPAAVAARDASPVPTVDGLVPSGLRGFLLRADEPATHTFSRTPSFGWKAVRGATSYEFQLSKSPTFSDNGLLWEDTTKTPAASVPIALPWVTGNPYSLYARVRAVTGNGTSVWSEPFGFDMRWPQVPKPLPAGPGYVRWTQVGGATGYDIWFLEPNRWFGTSTNVADEREYYDFHQSSLWTGVVRWRVRATRTLFGATLNGLPAVSYGPWSPVYTSYNPPFTVGPLSLVGTVSDSSSNALTPGAHSLMPSFLFTGNQALDGKPYELYRTYVFTDRDCVNMVFRGAIVGGPAYAPRPVGPLDMPKSDGAIDAARTSFIGRNGTEGTTSMADGTPITTTELDKPPTSSDSGSGSSGSGSGSSGSGSSGSGSSGSGGGSSPPSLGGAGSTGSSLPPTLLVQAAPVDLWDSDWPTGRYYWTVVPVQPIVQAAFSTVLTAAAAAGSSTIQVASTGDLRSGDPLVIGPASNQETSTVGATGSGTITLTTPLRLAHSATEPVVKPSGSVEYRDAELPQDACAAGRVLSFGKQSQPVVTATTAPFATGLSPKGRLTSAVRPRPSFYGYPVVAWRPAAAAGAYELQWSKRGYPWKAEGTRYTYSTSLTLPLSPGLWYYRVRGIDFLVPGGRPQMSWSQPVALRVAKPTFRVVKR